MRHKKRRASSTTWLAMRPDTPPPTRKRFNSLPRSDSISSDKLENILHEIKSNRECNRFRGGKEILELPPPCTCPYFGDKPQQHTTILKPAEVRIIHTSASFRNQNENSPVNENNIHRLSISASTNSTITQTSSSSKSLSLLPTASPIRKLSYSKTNSIVTWDSHREKRRGSSFGCARTSLLTPPKTPLSNLSPLRRSATLKNHNNLLPNDHESMEKTQKIPSSPCLLQRTQTIRSHHSRNSSVISRNSSRHGRIIRLEQKATKVLGVVFFTFVILWAPFFVLNLLPTVCQECEHQIGQSVFDIVTWLGYASSMVNPIFYTIFNKVFRQAFKKVLLCKYRRKTSWRPHR